MWVGLFHFAIVYLKNVKSGSCEHLSSPMAICSPYTVMMVNFVSNELASELASNFARVQPTIRRFLPQQKQTNASASTVVFGCSSLFIQIVGWYEKNGWINFLGKFEMVVWFEIATRFDHSFWLANSGAKIIVALIARTAPAKQLVAHRMVSMKRECAEQWQSRMIQYSLPNPFLQSSTQS